MTPADLSALRALAAQTMWTVEDMAGVFRRLPSLLSHVAALAERIEALEGALKALMVFHGADDATLDEMAAPDYREACKRARRVLGGKEGT